MCLGYFCWTVTSQILATHWYYTILLYIYIYWLSTIADKVIFIVIPIKHNMDSIYLLRIVLMCKVFNVQLSNDNATHTRYTKWFFFFNRKNQKYILSSIIARIYTGLKRNMEAWDKGSEKNCQGHEPRAETKNTSLTAILRAHTKANATYNMLYIVDVGSKFMLRIIDNKYKKCVFYSLYSLSFSVCLPRSL